MIVRICVMCMPIINRIHSLKMDDKCANMRNKNTLIINEMNDMEMWKLDCKSYAYYGIYCKHYVEYLRNAVEANTRYPYSVPHIVMIFVTGMIMCYGNLIEKSSK
eukprot:185909_1